MLNVFTLTQRLTYWQHSGLGSDETERLQDQDPIVVTLQHS